MEYKIEKMNRMRRNILLGVLFGTIIVFSWFLVPSFFGIFRFRNFHFYALLLWILIFLIFGARYILYRKKLLKEPSLRAAVNDERIRLNWLRAYRFTYFVIIGIVIFWHWQGTSWAPDFFYKTIILPHGPWLIVFGAVISLVGSFLCYNRESQNG